MNYDVIIAILFVLVVSIFLIKNRKKLKIEKMLFPVLYLILFRTKFGLKFMDKIAKKYTKAVKIFGFISIFFGFIGMVYVLFSIILNTINLITKPAVTEGGMALILPFTEAPIIGYLPFVQWILALFILMVVHEFSHGIVTRAYDMKVKSSGFGFLAFFVPILPLAFVEPDEKRLAKKSAKIQNSMYAAGPMANIVLAIILFLIMNFLLVPVHSKMTYPVGFSFDVINETMPAAKAGLENGMVIVSFNNKSVNDAYDFINYIHLNSSVNETIYLETENETFVVVTEEVDNRSMVGVTNIKNEVRYKENFTWIKKPFNWIYSFSWILFWLNLLIGLVNLLPLAITDGGRMLKVSLEKFLSKKKANLIYIIVSGLMLFSILLGLIVQYVGNPFIIFS
jgi:membrane-associated protease RseP (regulator of RpoE activity)